MDVLRKKLKLTGNSNNTGNGTEKTESGLNKNKLLSTWYNMKYGKTIFSLESNTLVSNVQSPVWLLGQCYHRRMHKRIHYDEKAESLTEVESGIAAFHEDFSSKIWLTYRKNFKEFKNTQITTDCGWGCMIRSCQMMVANSLIQLKLGRHWRKFDPSKSVHLAEDIGSESMHKDIIRLFGDTYYEDGISPLSIHNLMDIAKDSFNKKPGDWFGPCQTAHILQKALEKNRDHNMLNDLRAYVAKDGTVYKGDIYEMCRIKKEIKASRSSFDSLINFDEYSIIDPNELLTPSSIALGGQSYLENVGFVPYIQPDCEHIPVENEQHLSPKNYPRTPNLRKRSLARSISLPSLNCSTFIPVLILVPLRLGRDEKLNPVYANCLKSFLATETCMGIIGGKPKHSLYFVGFQDDNLIHLDPHLSQDKVDVSSEDFNLESFHSKTPRKLPINKMDSSCCLGFLLENENQFEGWCELAMELAKPSYGVRSDYPLFTISDGASWEHLQGGGSNPQSSEEVLRHVQQLDSIDEAGIDANQIIPQNDEEEFVFI